MAEHRGARASICTGCVEAFAGAMPERRDCELQGVPSVRLATVQDAVAILEVRGPVRPEDLESARAQAADVLKRFAPGDPVRLRGVPPAALGQGWWDTPAGPLLVVAPGLPGGALPDLGPWLAWWELLDDDEAALGRALFLLSTDDFPGCADALQRVTLDEPRRDLVEAVRLVSRSAQGDWMRALDLLERLERRAEGLVRDVARYDLGRLLLASGRGRSAERVLEGLQMEDAPALLRALTPDVQRLGECRLGLQRLAAALEEHRAATGDLPDTLEDLRPRFLTRLPTCAGRDYGYRRAKGHFRLRCQAGHAGHPKGWPRWVHPLGPLTRPEERPGTVPPGTQPGSGPAEALGARRGLWLSAAREAAGDLRGATVALWGEPGPEAALHLALLETRLGHEPPVGTLELPTPFRLRQPALVGERLLRAAPHLALRARWGLFLALVRGGRPDLCRHVRPDPSAGRHEARVAWLCDAAGWCSASPRLRGTPGELLGHALQLAYDHVTPEATLLLELARVCEEVRLSWVSMLLARLYRQARRWQEAESALGDARGYPGAFRALEENLIALERDRTQEALHALLTTVESHPKVPELRLELLVRMSDVGAPVDPGLVPPPGTPQSRLVRAFLVERRDGPEAALAQYGELRAQFPSWPSPLLFEAQALEALDRREEAAALCREGLEVRPDHVLLHALLLRLDPAAEASRERLRTLRPDLEDPASLDLRVIDWPTPDGGLLP